MAEAILTSGGIVLPPPVKITTQDEIIWSENTGRVASGMMVGDIIAEKKNIDIGWGILQESEIVLIKKTLVTGFFPLTFRDDGVLLSISGYRGTLQKEHIGRLSDGIYWYRSAAVSIIQQ